MDCSCAIDVYDGDCEPVSLLKINTRKAVKIHKCQECKKEIPKGEKYEYASYLFEGKFWHDKTCNDCLSAREQFYPHGGNCSGGLWTDIEIEVNEIDGEIPESCISNLTDIARERLCDLIDAHYRKVSGISRSQKTGNQPKY